MRKRNRIVLLLVCMFFSIILYGCGKDKKVYESERYGTVEVSADDVNWQQIETGEITLTSENLQLIMDADTTHFTLKDKKYDTEYNSAVTGVLDGAKMELNERAQAELSVFYYDNNGQKQEMNSYQHSVAFDNYKILTDGEAIRVYYTMQLKAAPPFVPKILAEEMFQNIASKLDSTSMFKMKLMYKYYPTDSVTSEAKELRAKTPYAKEHAVYVLNGNISESERTSLNRYMEQASYTQEQYYAELEERNITLTEEEMPMQFTVPVEYRILEDGFSVKALTDRMTASNDDYVLQSVSLLPFFNCGVVSDENGFMLLPDGSGSVMKTEKKDNAGYTQKIYGIDMACENQLTSVNSKNAVMPLFGYSSSQGSWISYIEGAEEMATVNAYRAGDTEYCAHNYAEFALRSTDSFTMRKSTVELAVFSKGTCVEQPSVRYVLLEAEAKLADMATCYRTYLQKAGELAEEYTTGALNVYLEFTGYMTQEASFLGVSYEKKVVLSTLHEIKESVERLAEEGVQNIYVRLSGFTEDGGKYNGLTDDFSLDSAVGSIEELKELAEFLAANGGGLYLEDEIQMVYRDGALDTFSSTSDTVRRLDKTLADYSDYNLVTGKNEDHIHVRYLVSPKLYESLATRFKEGLSKAAGTDFIYVSSGGAGRYLISDFNTEDEFDRVQASNALKKALEALKGEQSLMSDVGNSYVLGLADHILNMALTDSSFVAEDYAVPFYQMVLHGNLDYAGEAINMARNSEKAEFDTLICGAHLYYSCVTDKEALESLKGEQKLYPIDFSVVYDEITEFVQTHQDLYVVRKGKPVTDFELLANGLIAVEYGNSETVIFNETEQLLSWNGQQIPRRNYVIVGK